MCQHLKGCGSKSAEASAAGLDLWSEAVHASIGHLLCVQAGVCCNYFGRDSLL